MRVANVFLLVTWGVALGSILHGSQQSREPLELLKLELTKTDITTALAFRSNQATVFGISLGMTRAEVQDRLSSQRDIEVRSVEFDPKSLDVYGPTKTSQSELLVRFAWKADQRLREICLFQAFGNYLQGQTRDLVAFTALEGPSPVVRSFLGPDDHVSGQNSNAIKHSFPDKGIELFDIHNGADRFPIFVLVLPESPDEFLRRNLTLLEQFGFSALPWLGGILAAAILIKVFGWLIRQSPRAKKHVQPSSFCGGGAGMKGLNVGESDYNGP
jgi:hypothetical protein